MKTQARLVTFLATIAVAMLASCSAILLENQESTAVEQLPKERSSNKNQTEILGDWTDSLPAQFTGETGDVEVPPYVHLFKTFVAPNNRVFLAWIGSSSADGIIGTRVYLSERTSSGEWRHPQSPDDALSPPTQYGVRDLSLSGKSDGDVVVAWTQDKTVPGTWDSRLYFAERRNGKWNKPKDDSEYISVVNDELLRNYVYSITTAHGRDDHVLIAWSQIVDTDYSRRYLFKATRDPAGVWTLPSSTADSFSLSTGNNSIVDSGVDRNGNIALAWIESGELYFAEGNGGAWTFPTSPADSLSGGSASNSILAMDMNLKGDIILAWEESSRLKTKRRKNGTWTGTKAVSFSDPLEADVSINKSSEVAISWRSYYSGGSGGMFAAYKRKTGGWVIPSSNADMLSINGERAWHNPHSIDIGDSGDIAMTWLSNNVGVYRYYIAENIGGTWTAPASTTDALSIGGQVAASDIYAISSPVLSFDYNNNLLLFARLKRDIASDQYSLFYLSEKIAGTWRFPTSPEDTLILGNAAASSPYVNINTHGDKVVAWLQNSGTYDVLFVATYIDGEWSYPSGAENHLSLPGSKASDVEIHINDSKEVLVTWAQTFSGDTLPFKAEYKNGVWTKPSSDADHLAFAGVSISRIRSALSNNGQAVVMFGDPNEPAIYKAEKTSGVWTKPASTADSLSVAGTSPLLGSGLEVKINSSGDVAAVWSQRIAANNMYFAYRLERIDGVWGSPTALSGGGSVGTPGKPSIAMNDNGYVIAIHSMNNFFYRTEKISGVWQAPVSMSAGSGWLVSSDQPVVDVNEHGEAIVAWYQRDSDNLTQLYVADRRSDGSWRLPVDSEDHLTGAIVSGTEAVNLRSTHADGYTRVYALSMNSENDAIITLTDGRRDKIYAFRRESGGAWSGVSDAKVYNRYDAGGVAVAFPKNSTLNEPTLVYSTRAREKNSTGLRIMTLKE